MKFLYIKLVGYIGILDLPSIEIDFTKCKHNITVISGPNGAGKSRLMNAISVIPDSNDCFVDTMDGEKDFIVQDGENIYEGQIQHPLNSSNKRGTPKGYIQKNGVELNPNGNITSYRDIVFSEFDLDASFLTLSRLSGDDRGIVDKKPAERRKFVSSILSNLEVYNEIHKTLTKKVSIFRSHVNGCSDKIRNVGDESYIRSSLQSVESRIETIQSQIIDCNTKIAKCDALLSINKIDEDTKQNYEKAKNDYDTIKMKKVQLEKEIKNFYMSVIKKGYGEISNLDLAIHTTQEDNEKNKEKLAELHVQGQQQVQNISSIHEEIDRLQLKLERKQSEYNSDLVKQIELYSRDLSVIEDEFKRLEIQDMSSITAEEVNYLVELITQIVSEIDYFYEKSTGDMITLLRDCHYNATVVQRKLEEQRKEINTLEEEISEIRETLVKMKADSTIIVALDQKPSDCKNDNCPFISQAYSIIKDKYGTKENFVNRLQEFEIQIDEKLKTQTELNEIMMFYQEAFNNCTILGTIRNEINRNKALLSKLRISTRLIDESSFFTLIEQQSSFNFLRDLNSYLSISNHLIEYKAKMEIKNRLLSEQQVQEKTYEMIQEYQEELKIQEKKLEEENKSYESIKKENDFVSEVMEFMLKKKERLNHLKEMEDSYKSLGIEEEGAKETFEKLGEVFQSCRDTLDEMSRLNDIKWQLQKELEPLQNQKKKFDAQLIMLSEYQEEYQQYQQKYDLVKKLQEYSSPKAGGIQELYIDLYMSKTLDLANQLLGIIFGGRYKLLNYVIQDGEFRIPFMRDGFTIDDVSFGSRSQICMIGMIVSLVMRHQASDHYNITSLDEIDSGLDHENRYLFVDVLYKMVSILNIEQLFVISHSIELSTNLVDVIQLSDKEEYNDMFQNSNVIFKKSL